MNHSSSHAYAFEKSSKSLLFLMMHYLNRDVIETVTSCITTDGSFRTLSIDSEFANLTNPKGNI